MRQWAKNILSNLGREENIAKEYLKQEFLKPIQFYGKIISHSPILLVKKERSKLCDGKFY
jgi:hypothetical protein